MKATIKREDTQWATVYKLYLDERGHYATLTIERECVWGTGEPRPPEINWSALGPQDPATTIAFTKGLLELAEIAVRHQ